MNQPSPMNSAPLLKGANNFMGDADVEQVPPELSLSVGISIHNIRKTYPNGKEAIRGTSMFMLAI
jgi:hypothetical protein